MTKSSSRLSLNFFDKKTLDVTFSDLPEIRIVLRGDGGFSLPEIIEVCEKSGVGYVFGFSNNDVLKRKIN